jgi:hypothetical protein
MEDNAKDNYICSHACHDSHPFNNSAADSSSSCIHFAYRHEETRYGDIRGNSYRNNTNSIGSFYDYSSSDYGITFFIKERKRHYFNLITFVFRHLSTLSSGDIDNSSSSLFDRLRLTLYIATDSGYYGSAKQHMLKYSPNLPAQIDSLVNNIGIHNQNVENLRALVDDTINQAFRKPSNPTIPQYYNYSFDNVRDIVLGVWNLVIMNQNNSDNNLSIIENRITNHIHDKKKFEFDESDDILRLNTLLIGEGNDDKEI